MPQSAPPPGARAGARNRQRRRRQNQKIEHIHVEDSGATVDEVRYGGQTQSITVTPKANVPSYEVLPNDGGRDAPGPVRNRHRRQRPAGLERAQVLSAAVAVFTEVGFDEADALVQRLGLGPLAALRGIEGGIENTNYFASTASGEFVLTLFERLGAEQLPYYLCLMKHLAARGIPVPEPVADPAVAPPDGHALSIPANAPCEFLHKVAGKPAAVVQRLQGKSELAPTAAHCAELGRLLARMHLAARDFPRMPAQSARPALVERHRAGGAATSTPRKPRCCKASSPTRTTSPNPRPMPPCRAGRCMPTCSATTRCSTPGARRRG